ncbi:cytoplasmic tRNA 2-thiolation protein 2-like [Acipenser ruthenus]|uniref:cytoplasmic tRNA 2-thiolation protein 2-like n=1 Tax=Acipenser ruthenus TaxID=7906 RepID=UPI002741D21D|nr:cytoplasmic tRNA 2-thiolation protein 2-like [Acipenser ruthenus]
MCQIDEDYIDAQLETKAGLSVSRKCMKCKEGSAVLIIRVGDAFCGDCFKEYFVHKFRAMLGKNRLIFPGEKVLLSVSGGPASSALLSQVQEGLSPETPKKLRFVPGIIYVDEGAACGQSLEERGEIKSQLETIFRASGFPFYVVHLEAVFSLPSSVLQCASSALDRQNESYKEAVDGFIQSACSETQRETGQGSNSYTEVQTLLSELSTQEWSGEVGIVTNKSQPFTPEQTEAVRTLLASVKTLTAREELLKTLRQHLILHTARVRGYSKVMMGDSCSRLAVKLLTNISLGRGAFLAMDTGFSDPRYGDIAIVRPMREYSSKEIAFYNRMFKVPSVFTSALDTKAPEKASIHRLTESFISKLQADFPSTVSTIYRTSEKLNTACPRPIADGELTEKCLLCLCALDTGAEEATAFRATLISENLSCNRMPATIPALGVAKQQCCASGGEQKESCGDRVDGCHSVDRTSFTPELQTLLCYSCRLIIKDMTSVNSVPEYILSEAERRKRRAQMKEEIQDFLLNPENDAVEMTVS